LQHQFSLNGLESTYKINPLILSMIDLLVIM